MMECGISLDSHDVSEQHKNIRLLFIKWLRGAKRVNRETKTDSHNPSG